MVPATANIKELVPESPSFKPIGIEIFSSRKGTIDVKKTINSLFMDLI